MEMHDEDTRMGLLIKAHTGSGKTSPCFERERGKTTRGINAKINNANNPKQQSSWEAESNDEGTSSAYKLALPCHAMTRRNSPKPGTFTQTATGQTGPLITRTLAVARTASNGGTETLVIGSPAPRLTRE